MRLRVVRSRNWKWDRGYRWRCNDPEAIKAHPSRKPIEGFSADDTFTSRRGICPPSLSRAMDGARKHLIRYHLEEITLASTITPKEAAYRLATIKSEAENSLNTDHPQSVLERVLDEIAAVARDLEATP